MKLNQPKHNTPIKLNLKAWNRKHLRLFFSRLQLRFNFSERLKYRMEMLILAFGERIENSVQCLSLFVTVGQVDNPESFKNNARLSFIRILSSTIRHKATESLKATF